MTYYTRFNSPLCEIILVGDEQGLSRLHLETDGGQRQFHFQQNWQRNDVFFSEVIKQLNEYFNGQRHTFDIKTNPQGTPFQRRVWQQLTTIGYGERRSYKDVASAIGNDKASRAVGMANNKNPLPLIIPCHRVVGSNGKLTGFAHGLEMKEQLLELEQQNAAIQ